MITNIDAAYDALHAAMGDAEADHPEMESDSYAADIIASLSYDMDGDVFIELCRRELGFVPIGAAYAPRDFLDF